MFNEAVTVDKAPTHDSLIVPLGLVRQTLRDVRELVDPSSFPGDPCGGERWIEDPLLERFRCGAACTEHSEQRRQLLLAAFEIDVHQATAISRAT